MKVWMPHTAGGSGADTFTAALSNELRALGCETVEQTFPHRLQYAPWALSGVAPPPGADIALVNSWNGLAFRRPGLRLVVVCHLCVHDPAFAPFRSVPQTIFHRALVRRFEARSFAVADAAVAVSATTAAAVRDAFPGVEPVVIRNGIDTRFFTPAEQAKARAPGDPFRLLFVGNPIRRKGADLLDPILEKLGEGFVLEYTSGLRDRGALSSPRAVPLGALGSEEVRSAYRRADAFLFPTRLEGLPLTVLEAMACGTPIVGSDRSSMPEAVEDGREGFLRPPEPEALSAAVRTLAADPDLRETMGRAARERAASEFTLGRMAHDYLDLLERIV